MVTISLLCNLMLCVIAQVALDLNDICKERDNMFFEFPILTGHYPVGTTVRYSIDTDRPEPHNPSMNRELMIRIWYPRKKSVCDEHVLNPYSKEAIESAKLLNTFLGISEQESQQLEMVQTHALPESAPSTDGPFPIIFFEHGYIGSVPEVYTSLCEELASYGYVVVAPAHTYYAGQVTFPDGRIISYAPEKYAVMKSNFYRLNDQEIWIADVQFVLNELSHWSADGKDMFYNRFDLSHVGVFGHSFGGLIALQLCLGDSRFKAGVSLDGVSFGPDISPADLDKPFMFLIAEGSAQAFDNSNEELAKKYSWDVQVMRDSRKEFEKMQSVSSDSVSYHVIPNTQHNAFSDFAFLKTLPLYQKNTMMHMMVGTADGVQTIEHINRDLVHFFEVNIKKMQGLSRK